MTRPLFIRRRAALLGAALLAGCATAPGGIAPPPASAVPELRVALATAPDDPVAAWRLAAALRGADRAGEARTVLEESLERTPDHPPSLQLLGRVLEDLDRPAEAVVVYERLLALPNAGALRGPVSDRLEAARRAALQAEIAATLAEEARLAATPPEARTVAVFPFEYRGSNPDHAPLGRALTHMLVTDLAATDRFTVLERLEVQLLADEIGRTDTGLTDPATGVRGGRMLGAEHVVIGQVGGDAARIDLSAGVVAATSDSPQPVNVDRSDAVERFFELEATLALGLFEALGVQLTAAERERVGRRPTESLAALLAFGLGLEAQDEGRYGEAREHFERAVALDPSFEDASGALDTATRLDLAANLPGDAFVAIGGELMAPTLDDLWWSRRTDFLGVETLLPTLGGRDPWAELLDGESLAPVGGTLIITLPHPGGSP